MKKLSLFAVIAVKAVLDATMAIGAIAPCPKCGHEMSRHLVRGTCSVSGCKCAPAVVASPCRSCGHAKAQHPAAGCTVAGCRCGKYVAMPPVQY